jgi:taurine dioxygenase
MASKQLFDVRPLTGSLGAEIRGVNIREPVSDEVRAALRATWLKHLVLFFPDQHPGHQELKNFGSIWGKLTVYDFAPASKDDPDVVELAAGKGSGVPDIWHTDLTHWESPALASIASMVKLPPVGGDTQWSNQYDAYETLSAPMRSLVDGLTAIHEYPSVLYKHTAGNTTGSETHLPAEHPVVRVHAETGRRHLYVNRMYTTRIPQLSKGESDALLAHLFTHSVDPRFVVRYRWTEGTVVIWDNRCTQHCVVNDFDGERILRRVTVGGDKVEKLNSPWETYKATRGGLTAKLEAAANAA